MKAVAMKGFGSADVFTLEERPTPSPKEGEVRIRIKAAGFNPVDWKIRENWFGGDPNQILGCECSGVVDALGADVKEFAVGDEVYAMSIMRSSNGSYAEFACVPVELVAAKPKQLSFEEAAAIPLAAMTAYRATLALPVFKHGDSVFIAGAGGGVGTFATQMIRSAGVKEIFTIAKNEKSSLFLQNELGFAKDHILLYEGLSHQQMKEKLIAMNKGNLFQATVDLVGKEMKKLCLELTGYSGHFSTALPEKDFVFPIWEENSIPRGRNISILQVAVGAQLGEEDRKYWDIYAYHFEMISEMLEKGTLKPPVVEVVGTLSASAVQKAHALLEQGRVKGKLVMTVG